MLAGNLPPSDVFELHMPALAMQGKRKPKIEQVQIALVAWIEATAPTINEAFYNDPFSQSLTEKCTAWRGA
jgi:hypothetical protein